MRPDLSLSAPRACKIAAHRIALLFNASTVYDRQILSGIADYLDGTRANWQLFLEDDLHCRPGGIVRWDGDGIIANFDNAAVRAALRHCRLPLVAIGSSYADPSSYPAGVPYVASDNAKLVELAYHHLVEVGLTRFAMFSLPESDEHRWASERERTFRRLTRGEDTEAAIFRGRPTSAETWSAGARELQQWLLSLPKPVGIVAVNDARARLVLQACEQAGIAVPGQVAVVGIDDDPVTRKLGRIALSSVIQGAESMGRLAAQLLHQSLHGKRQPACRAIVPPAGINIQASSRHTPATHPHIMRALHFIRQFGCCGIRTEQVADYVGISRSTIDTYFRQELGRSVHDEILRTKLDQAARMLSDPDASIAEAAQKCGFTSVQYMHAVFKRELGCTPRKFKDQLLRSAAAGQSAAAG